MGLPICPMLNDRMYHLEQLFTLTRDPKGAARESWKNMPNPEHTTERDSIQSYRRTTALIKEYIGRVAITTEGVEVRDSRHSIRLGTPSAPEIRAPIDLHPGHLEELLRIPVKLIDDIQLACKETIRLTTEASRDLHRLIDASAREELMRQVQERTSEMEALASALDAASSGQPPPYHPARLAHCLEAMKGCRGDGDPRIVVKYEVTQIL